MDGRFVLRISSKVKAAPQRGAPPHHRTSASVAGIRAMSCGALWDSTTALNDMHPKYREALLCTIESQHGLLRHPSTALAMQALANERHNWI